MNPSYTPGSLFLTPRAPNGKRLPASAQRHMRGSEDRKSETVPKEMQGLEGQMMANQFSVAQIPPQKGFWDERGVPPTLSHEMTPERVYEMHDKSLNLPSPPRPMPGAASPAPAPQPTSKDIPQAQPGLGQLLRQPSAEDLKRAGKDLGTPQGNGNPYGLPFKLPFDPSKVPLPYFHKDKHGWETGVGGGFRF